MKKLELLGLLAVMVLTVTSAQAQKSIQSVSISGTGDAPVSFLRRMSLKV